jgi:hypothetical protein
MQDSIASEGIVVRIAYEVFDTADMKFEDMPGPSEKLKSLRRLMKFPITRFTMASATPEATAAKAAMA